MRTNIVLDDALVEKAFRCFGNIKTKKELVETALSEYIMNRKRKNLADIKGKIVFREKYDYKSLREDS